MFHKRHYMHPPVQPSVRKSGHRRNICVRTVIEQANGLLPEDKQSATMVEAVAASFESEGVAWTWQMSVDLSLADLGWSHWQEAGASQGLWRAAIDVLMSDEHGEDESPLAPHGAQYQFRAPGQETAQPAREQAWMDVAPGPAPSCLQMFPDDVRRFLFLPDQTGKRPKFLNSIAAYWISIKLQPLDSQFACIRTLGDHIAIMSALLLPVVWEFRDRQGVDPVMKSWKDGVSASDVKEAVTMLTFFSFLTSVMSAWLASFCATSWGGTGHPGELVRYYCAEVIDGCLQCIGLAFLGITIGGFWGMPIIISWETWVRGHPILSVCVICIGAAVHLGVFGLLIIGTKLHPCITLELLHLPKWQQLALVPVTPMWLKAMFGDTKFWKSAKDRAEQLRRQVAEMPAEK